MTWSSHLWSTNIYINEKSLTVSTPCDLFETEQLQAISMRFSRLNIDYHHFNRTFTLVTNSESAILSIWRIFVLDDRTMWNFIRIENNVWVLILQ